MGDILEPTALVGKRKRTPNQNPESKVIYLFRFRQFVRDKEREIEDTIFVRADRHAPTKKKKQQQQTQRRPQSLADAQLAELADFRL